jgi:chemotaxis protein CheY-P-specific phosphatase CheC
MKRIFTLLIIGIFLSSFTFFSSIDEVITAMKGGNASEVARFFDNTVEINTPDKSGSYSKSQGELVLKDFFNTNAIKAFTTEHKGENAGSQFCIGTLITKTTTYRTKVFMKLKGDKQLLQAITFELK